MKNVLSFAILSILCACGSVSNQTSEKIDSSNKVVPESKVVETPPSMEQLYAEKLAGSCDCDIATNFELEGEGESFPLLVNVEGEDKEFQVTSGHISGWDGKAYFYIDSLGDSTSFPVHLAKIHEQSPLKNTWLTGGPVYAWPDEHSEVLYQLKSDSYWGWDRCYENWVRVSQWDANKSEYRNGWVKKP